MKTLIPTHNEIQTELHIITTRKLNEEFTASSAVAVTTKRTYPWVGSSRSGAAPKAAGLIAWHHPNGKQIQGTRATAIPVVPTTPWMTMVGGHCLFLQQWSCCITYFKARPPPPPIIFFNSAQSCKFSHILILSLKNILQNIGINFQLNFLRKPYKRRVIPNSSSWKNRQTLMHRLIDEWGSIPAEKCGLVITDITHISRYQKPEKQRVERKVCGTNERWGIGP